jgi:hypothetical protein
LSGKVETGYFEVNRGVDGEYFQRLLTRDISAMESVHDLVDNAVDAARDCILCRPDAPVDQYGLPADYSGFRISLRLGASSISILDNCTGIDPITLSERVFVTGSESSHRFGIGFFGVGLKRALLRLGATYCLHTDTGSTASRMLFSSSELGGSGGGQLSALTMPTRGKPKTLIHVSGLHVPVRHETGSEAWREALLSNFSRRYGRYIGKGLSLSVNGIPVPSFAPSFRSNSPVPRQSANFTTSEGVQVFVDAGMHEAYRLTHEKDYVKDDIYQLTNQYGWYFVCNDRVVRVASHETDLGWSASWHQEYYGFLGWVHFVDPEVVNLPWDTKKTTIDPASSVFRQVAGRLQGFAEDYKTANKKAKKSERDSDRTSASTATARSRDPVSKTEKTRTPRPQDERNTEAHNERWSTLLPRMEYEGSNPKLSALLDEASRLKVEECYAGAMLLRAVFEHALWEALKTSRRLKDVKQSIFDAQAKDGRPFTDDQKKRFRPKLRDMIDWLSGEPEFFAEDERKEAIMALRKFSQHLSELNGVTHEATLIDSGKLKIVRNDTIHLLMGLLKFRP